MATFAAVVVDSVGITPSTFGSAFISENAESGISVGSGVGTGDGVGEGDGVGVGASVGCGVGSAVGTAVGSLVGRGVVSGAALVPHAERMPSAAISMAAARRFVLLLMGCSP